MVLNKNKPGIVEQGWDRPQIITALWRIGWSLRQLSIKNGYAPGTLSAALYRSFPRGEAIIAAALGVSPTVIWPARHAERARRKRQSAR